MFSLSKLSKLSVEAFLHISFSWDTVKDCTQPAPMFAVLMTAVAVGFYTLNAATNVCSNSVGIK